MTTHHCPWCRCLPDDYNEMGIVNKNAEFYPLVELIDSLTGEFGRLRAGLPAKLRVVETA